MVHEVINNDGSNGLKLSSLVEFFSKRHWQMVMLQHFTATVLPFSGTTSDKEHPKIGENWWLSNQKKSKKWVYLSSSFQFVLPTLVVSNPYSFIFPGSIHTPHDVDVARVSLIPYR